MTKITKFSFTSIEKYNRCPALYKYHYIDKIRSNKTPSALLFGNSIDLAINRILLEKKKNLTDLEKESLNSSEYDIFLKEFKSDQEIEYTKKDLDLNLIKDEEAHFDERTKSFLSLQRKAKLLLEQYRIQVFPKIIEVVSIQSEKALDDGTGNLLTTKTDFICHWLTPGNIVLFDNKTASAPYPKDAVNRSSQLMIYSEAEEITQCGFIVLIKDVKSKRVATCQKCGYVTGNKSDSCINKVLGKRCKGAYKEEFRSEVRIQELVAYIDDSESTTIFDSIESSVESIQSGYFDKNQDSCYQYGRKCDLWNWCKHGKMEGLVKK